MQKKGIDVSKYQSSVDFAKVKSAGYDFVIIRAGYGKSTSQKDPMFDTHYKNATAAGLGVGAYWYSYASSEDDAKAEAAACIEVIKGKKFSYPIYFDLEEKTQFAKGKTFCTSIINAFCTKLENEGYFAGLYMSRSPLQQYVSSETASRYALWIAEYNSKCGYSGDYGMWQYTSSGTVSGISGSVDCDYCYTDYPTLIKSAGLNGYTKTSASAKVLDESGFKSGDKSDGVLAYKCLLLLAAKAGIITAKLDENGSFGDGTEKATNALLKKLGYSENSVAGSALIKKLYKLISDKI
jgi:GH25 family lysozyme M1 (1,4-beta-N-acetylmuramidase)